MAGEAGYRDNRGPDLRVIGGRTRTVEKTVEPDTCRADQHEDQGNCDRRLSMAMFDRRFGPRLPVAHGRDQR